MMTTGKIQFAESEGHLVLNCRVMCGWTTSAQRLMPIREVSAFLPSTRHYRSDEGRWNRQDLHWGVGQSWFYPVKQKVGFLPTLVSDQR